MPRLLPVLGLLLCISGSPLIAEPSSQKSSPAQETASARPDEPVVVVDEEEDVELVIELGVPDKPKPAAPPKAPKSAKSSRKQDISAKSGTSSAPKEKDIAQMQRFGRLGREALSFRGAKYVWGGEDITGFDCSGFTQYLLGKRGIKLPRTAKEQFGGGKPVDREDLKDGDLVFFNTQGPISHVGIYIGDDTFCHAANPRRGVTTNRLDDSFYGPRYAGARRYSAKS